MLLALLAVASAASWVPARWHSGDPKSLQLIGGTPINCLLVDNPKLDATFVKAAHAQHIAVLNSIHSADDVRRAAKWKMDGAVFEGAIDATLSKTARQMGLQVIELPARHNMRFDSRDAIIGTSQGLWPGVEIEHGGKTVIGPTSAPWIYTNGGFLRFARAATDAAAIWISVRPPPRTIYPIERYAQVIGDAALAGARWVVALDDDLDSRLLASDPAAIKDWKRIAAYLAYYENHPEWRNYRAYSLMAVIQDTGSGGLLSSSLLDMLASQRTGVRVVPTRKLDGTAISGARVVLDVDPDSLRPEQKKAIDDFVKHGGTVINPPAKWHFPQTSDDQIVLERRQADQLQSLWEVTYNATVRKNFGARTFNTTGILSSVLATPDGNSVLVHLVNFLDFPGEAITIHVLGKWKHARLFQIDGPTVDLPVFDVPEGTGVEIEKVSLLTSVRLD
jgi:hypothetical protein